MDMNNMIHDQYIIYSSFDILLNAIHERKNFLLSQLNQIYDKENLNKDKIHVNIIKTDTENILNMINEYGSIKIEKELKIIKKKSKIFVFGMILLLMVN